MRRRVLERSPGRDVSIVAILALLPGGCRAVAPRPDWTATLGYEVGELHPLAVGKFGCPFVPVRLDGEEVFLEFDTGNMTGLAVSRDLARRLGLAVAGEWRSLDSDDTEIGRFPVFRVGEVQVFGESWKDVRVHGLPTDDLEGLVGPAFLSGKRFTADYAAGLLAVSDRPLPARAGGEAFPLVPVPSCEGMPVVEAEVAGRRVFVQLDTGKSRTCVDRDFAAEVGLPATPRGYRLEEIRLGSFSFSVPHARAEGFEGISEGLPSPIAVGLGSDVLSRVVFTIDYGSGTLLLSTPSRSAP
jgi:predicted aspartyl protease